MDEIAAIILAAGQSKRMGAPKLLLPWGRTTVLGQVLDTLRQAGLTRLLVVSGAYRQEIEAVANACGAETVFNPNYATGEMLSSLQVGLQALPDKVEAALICLGDQPQMQAETVRRICQTFLERRTLLVIPRYQERNGHPWLIARPLWPEMLALSGEATARQFLQAHAHQICHVPADASILRDLDTPEAYQQERP